MDSTKPVSEAPEPISACEFMRRMGIKKTTFHKWKKTGKLVRRKHYVQAGGFTIIFWSIELLRELDDLPLEPPIKSSTGYDSLDSTPTIPRKRSAIDLSY